jgi:hypothetical protein
MCDTLNKPDLKKSIYEKIFQEFSKRLVEMHKDLFKIVDETTNIEHLNDQEVGNGIKFIEKINDLRLLFKNV